MLRKFTAFGFLLVSILSVSVLGQSQYGNRGRASFSATPTPKPTPPYTFGKPQPTQNPGFKNLKFNSPQAQPLETTPTTTPPGTEGVGGGSTGLDAEEMAGACIGDAQRAEGACGTVEMTTQISTLIGTVSQAASAGDTKKACVASRALNTIGGTANAYFGMKCSSTAGKCMTTCTTALRDLRAQKKLCGETNAACISRYTEQITAAQLAEGKCGGLKPRAGAAYLAAANNAVGLIQSQACINLVNNEVKCETIADINDTSKPQCNFRLCGPGGSFRGTEHCKAIELNCQDSVNFGALYCICKDNPQSPGCPGSLNGNLNGGIDGGGLQNGGGNNNLLGDTEDGGFADNDLLNVIGEDGQQDPFAGKKENQAAGGGSQMQPGAAFAPGGGFNGNPAGGGKGGSGRGPYNTDILQGTGGSGSYSGGGSGSYPSGSDKDGSGASSDGMNLRDFLPGGKRAIAGKAELEKNGVSDINGPSNFEKVTRQVNQLRRSKQTIETR